MKMLQKRQTSWPGRVQGSSARHCDVWSMFNEMSLSGRCMFTWRVLWGRYKPNSWQLFSDVVFVHSILCHTPYPAVSEGLYAFYVTWYWGVSGNSRFCLDCTLFLQLKCRWLWNSTIEWAFYFRKEQKGVDLSTE